MTLEDRLEELHEGLLKDRDRLSKERGEIQSVLTSLNAQIELIDSTIQKINDILDKHKSV